MNSHSDHSDEKQQINNNGVLQTYMNVEVEDDEENSGVSTSSLSSLPYDSSRNQKPKKKKFQIKKNASHHNNNHSHITSSPSYPTPKNNNKNRNNAMNIERDQDEEHDETDVKSYTPVFEETVRACYLEARVNLDASDLQLTFRDFIYCQKHEKVQCKIKYKMDMDLSGANKVALCGLCPADTFQPECDIEKLLARDIKNIPMHEIQRHWKEHTTMEEEENTDKKKKKKNANTNDTMADRSCSLCKEREIFTLYMRVAFEKHGNDRREKMYEAQMNMEGTSTDVLNQLNKYDAMLLDFRSHLMSRVGTFSADGKARDLK